jgi:hypothetical protein
MKATNELFRTLAIIAGIAGVLVISYMFGDRYLSMKDKQTKFMAIDACAHIARVSFESRDEATGQITRSELPSTDAYKQCMKDKGIEIK